MQPLLLFELPEANTCETKPVDDFRSLFGRDEFEIIPLSESTDIFITKKRTGLPYFLLDGKKRFAESLKEDHRAILTGEEDQPELLEFMKAFIASKIRSFIPLSVSFKVIRLEGQIGETEWPLYYNTFQQAQKYIEKYGNSFPRKGAHKLTFDIMFSNKLSFEFEMSLSHPESLAAWGAADWESNFEKRTMKELQHAVKYGFSSHYKAMCQLVLDQFEILRRFSPDGYCM